MAQRRMFSPEIVCSEEFLDMPPSAQSLYFQLGMRADDDGFVQPNIVARLIGSTKDDLKVILAKRFVLPFESGVVVIKHWLIHNMIRLDRYKETRFIEEKKTLFIKENKAYTDNPINGKPLLATKWQPNGNLPAPQVRLGKDSISNITDASVDAETPISRDTSVDQFGGSLDGQPPKTQAKSPLAKEFVVAFKKIRNIRNLTGYGSVDTVINKFLEHLEKDRGYKPKDNADIIREWSAFIDVVQQDKFEDVHMTSFGYINRNFNKLIKLANR